MECALAQMPVDNPGAVACSADNLVAVGVEGGVVIRNLANLEGDTGYVVLDSDDTCKADGDPGSAFPVASISGNARSPGLIGVRALLRRASRPELAACQVAWSQMLEVPQGAPNTTGPRCVLAVVTTSHEVMVYAPSAVETDIAWIKLCDLSALEREAQARGNADESATTPVPPVAPVEKAPASNAVASTLASASALPAPPVTPAIAAGAPQRALHANKLAAPPPPPPPTNALAVGARVEVQRGKSRHPATATELVDKGVFRVKVQYDVAVDRVGQEEWLAYEKFPDLFTTDDGNAADLWYEFPAKSSSCGYWLSAGTPFVSVPKPEARAATLVAAPATGAAATADAESESDSGDDESLAKLGGASKKKSSKDDAHDEDYEDAIAGRAAARKATVGALEVKKTAKLAMTAVFTASPPSKELIKEASDWSADPLKKKKRNAAIKQLALRVRDAYMAARLGAGITAVYARGEHKLEADRMCFTATCEEAVLKCSDDATTSVKAKPGKRKGATLEGQATLPEKTKKELSKVAQALARPLLLSDDTTSSVKAEKRKRQVADSEDDWDDSEPDDDAFIVPKESASRASKTGKKKQPSTASQSGAGVDLTKLRLAECLSATCVAWSDSSLIAVGAKSGDVVLWEATACAGAGDASVGITPERLGSTRVADAWVTSLAWIGDGRELMVGGSDGSVRLWMVDQSSSRLKKISEICPADGVPVTKIAVDCGSDDASGKLVAAGKASGTVAVFRVGGTVESPWNKRVFLEPVSGLAWCASIVAAHGAVASRLVVTSRTCSTTLDVISSPSSSSDTHTSTFQIRENQTIGKPSSGSHLKRAGRPDGVNIPVESQGPVACSPNGLCSVRVFQFHHPTNATGGRGLIAARARRGACVVEHVLGKRTRETVEDDEARDAAGALAARVKRVASTGDQGASLWDVRATAAALGEAGTSAALEGANRAVSTTRGDKKKQKRAKQVVFALTSAATPSEGAPADGLSCRACGGDTASGGFCVSCNLPLRFSGGTTMGLKSVVI